MINSSMYGHQNFCHSTSVLSMINSHHLLISNYGARQTLDSANIVTIAHCTLLHILNGCNHSLQDGRYNWHHDQTLRVIASGLAPYIGEANTRKGPTSEFNNFFPTITFRTADGTTYRNKALPLPKTEAKDILKKASNWIFLMDENHN